MAMNQPLQRQRESDIQRLRRCRIELEKVLSKYGAELEYTLNDSYSEDGGRLKLQNVNNIPSEPIKINCLDWSM